MGVYTHVNGMPSPPPQITSIYAEEVERKGGGEIKRQIKRGRSQKKKKNALHFYGCIVSPP